jgi:putative transcriptional regulator
MDKEVSPLAVLRKIRGNVTQAELGKAIGVSGNTIARWERGEVQPRLTPQQVVKLCHFLGIKLDDRFPESFAPKLVEDCTA